MNLARRRTLASMGTHDLDKVNFPITYEALPPEDIRFVALKQTEEKDEAEFSVKARGGWDKQVVGEERIL